MLLRRVRPHPALATWIVVPALLYVAAGLLSVSDLPPEQETADGLELAAHALRWTGEPAWVTLAFMAASVVAALLLMWPPRGFALWLGVAVCVGGGALDARAAWANGGPGGDAFLQACAYGFCGIHFFVALACLRRAWLAMREDEPPPRSAGFRPG